jgi:hypothetical protein
MPLSGIGLGENTINGPLANPQAPGDLDLADPLARQLADLIRLGRGRLVTIAASEDAFSRSF